MIKTVIFISLFFATNVFSQNLFINYTNRTITSLNGIWNYIVDPYENGYYNFHGEIYDIKNPTSSAAFYNNYHTNNKAELVEYDFDKSLTMHIPGDWNTQKENLFYYEGTIWFKKSFDYTISNNNRLYIYFNAINYASEIYLNGKKLGKHIGGFTPFNFEITNIVQPKNNFLVIKVDNKRLKEAVPTINTDWWNYGGITRDVVLIEEPKVSIVNYALTLSKTENKTINVAVQLNQNEHNENINITIPELKVNHNAIIANGIANFKIVVEQNINYWSPTNPKLYKVNIVSAHQSISDDIGFKTIETIGPNIVLNKKPIFLKGICLHEEINGRRAYTEKDAIKLLKYAKELGCNFVRLAHYPHNENMLRMADKMGLMVWEEIPVYWTIDFTNNKTFDNAKNQLNEVITRDKNRASVIIWSMANETPYSDERNNFIVNLINFTKSIDSTRLISAALLTHFKDGIGIIDDKLGSYLDVIAFNQYMGWYGGDLKVAPFVKWFTPYNKPVIVSEFGGDAKQGLHGQKEERWNEEYQEYLYQQNLLMIKNIPNLSGISPWILMDFRSPRRLLPGIQDGFNRKGLISNKDKKKKAFFTLKEFYEKLN